MQAGDVIRTDADIGRLRPSSDTGQQPIFAREDDGFFGGFEMGRGLPWPIAPKGRPRACAGDRLKDQVSLGC